MVKSRRPSAGFLGDWALIERRAHSLRPRYAVILCLAMLCVGAARRLRDLRWRALGPRHKSRQRVQRCLAHSSYRRLGHYSSPSLGSGLQGRADATSRTCVVNERQPFAKQVPTEQEHEAGSVRRFAPGFCTCFGTAVGWR